MCQRGIGGLHRDCGFNSECNEESQQGSTENREIIKIIV